MIKFFLWFLIVTAVVIGLVMLIQRDAGYILIAYDELSVESSLWAGLLALTLILLALYWLVRLLLKIRYSGRSLRYWREGRQARRNETQITQGLIQYMEGNWKASARTFSRGAERSPTPLLSYLMAARASDAAGDFSQCEEYLKQAEASTPDAHLAIGLTQAELQLQKGDYENCLANLNRIRVDQPDNELALKLSARVYEELSDWGGLQQILPQLRRKNLLNSDKLAELEFNAANAQLAAVTTATELTAVWSGMAKDRKKDPRLMAAYARALLANNNDVDAEPFLRSVLKKNWSPELVKLYGLAKGADGDKQLSAAEAWLKVQPDDPMLLQALGRISMANGNTEKAKEYFSASLAIKPEAETYGELGKLLAQLGDSEQSSEQYQKALSFEPAGLPAPKVAAETEND